MGYYKDEENKLVKYRDEEASSILQHFYLEKLSQICDGNIIKMEDLVIAGGKILSLLMDANYEPFSSKDWDVYIVDEFFARFNTMQHIKKRRKHIENLTDSASFANDYMESGGSVCFKLFEEKVELIDRAECSIEHLLRGFDLNISRTAWDPKTGDFLVDESLVDFLSGIDEAPEILIHQTNRPLFTLNRIAKYNSRGFPIEPIAFLKFVRSIMNVKNVELIETDVEYIKKWGFEFSV